MQAQQAQILTIQKETQGFDPNKAIRFLVRVSKLGDVTLTAHVSSVLKCLLNRFKYGIDLLDPSQTCCYPSIDYIERDTKISTARKIIRLLEDKGIISVTEIRAENGAQRNNIYKFTPLIWIEAQIFDLNETIKKMQLRKRDPQELEKRLASLIQERSTFLSQKKPTVRLSILNGQKGILQKEINRLERGILDGSFDKAETTSEINDLRRKLAELADQNNSTQVADFEYQAEIPRGGLNKSLGGDLITNNPNNLSYNQTCITNNKTHSTKYEKNIPSEMSENKFKCHVPIMESVKASETIQDTTTSDMEFLNDIFEKFAELHGYIPTYSEKLSFTRKYVKEAAKNPNIDLLIIDNLAIIEASPYLRAPRVEGGKHSLGRLLAPNLKAKDNLCKTNFKKLSGWNYVDPRRSSESVIQGRLSTICQTCLQNNWDVNLTCQWLFEETIPDKETIEREYRRQDDLRKKDLEAQQEELILSQIALNSVEETEQEFKILSPDFTPEIVAEHQIDSEQQHSEIAELNCQNTAFELKDYPDSPLKTSLNSQPSELILCSKSKYLGNREEKMKGSAPDGDKAPYMVVLDKLRPFLSKEEFLMIMESLIKVPAEMRTKIASATDLMQLCKQFS